MKGDEAQFFLDEHSYDASHEPQTFEIMEIRMKRIADQADKIGGIAGDEFYARAVSSAGGTRTYQGVDSLRYARGSSSLGKKFGIPKSQIVLPKSDVE
jgi:hypothetical protein